MRAGRLWSHAERRETTARLTRGARTISGTTDRQVALGSWFFDGTVFGEGWFFDVSFLKAVGILKLVF